MSSQSSTSSRPRYKHIQDRFVTVIVSKPRPHNEGTVLRRVKAIFLDDITLPDGRVLPICLRHGRSGPIK